MMIHIPIDQPKNYLMFNKDEYNYSSVRECDTGSMQEWPKHILL